MQPNWGLLEKIADGRKTVESRWYLTRRAPWGRINPGDTIYFKNSGQPVRLKATVRQVETRAGLSPERVRVLLENYAAADGIEPKDVPAYFERFKIKRYAIFIGLTDVCLVTPFNINKAGFGLQSAWVTVDNIGKIRQDV